MKGPAGRVKFRIRRQWECMRCHRKVWTSGEIVNRACEGCSTVIPPHTVWMHLVEPSRDKQALDNPLEKSPEARAVSEPPADEATNDCLTAPGRCHPSGA